MLFSATQSKKIEDLVTLSLSSKPVYVGVHDNQITATVEGLEQGYVVCPSDTRFLLLFTFLKRNKKKKVIVFMSSCAAVKYYSELLNYIDLPVLDLHVRFLSSFPFSFLVFFSNFSFFLRENKNKENEPILSLSSVMLKLAFCFVLMSLLVVLISLKSIGSFNMILLMILEYIPPLTFPFSLPPPKLTCLSSPPFRNTSTEWVELQEQEEKDVPCFSFFLVN